MQNTRVGTIRIGGRKRGRRSMGGRAGRTRVNHGMMATNGKRELGMKEKRGPIIRTMEGMAMTPGGPEDGGGEEKYDRQNEMIARGFNRNTYWKDIKARVEEVLGISSITYERVKVIGEKASFAIIKFDKYETKQEFKKWLSWHGKEVKQERGMLFGDNVDKRSRDRGSGWIGGKNVDGGEGWAERCVQGL
jgi:hypothetical protein